MATTDDPRPGAVEIAAEAGSGPGRWVVGGRLGIDTCVQLVVRGRTRAGMDLATTEVSQIPSGQLLAKRVGR
jgi:hypothetical protein